MGAGVDYSGCPERDGGGICGAVVSYSSDILVSS